MTLHLWIPARIRPSLLGAALLVGSFAPPTFAQKAPDSVLPDRPDADKGVATLDPAFISPSAGISIRPPAGGKMIRRNGVGDEVVRFVNEETKWTLVVSRVLLGEPVKLGSPDLSNPNAANAPDNGFAGTIASQMRTDTPGKLLRAELLPINGYDGALLASKFTEGEKRQLIQQAIIHRTDKTYYILSYYTPLTQDDAETDPAAIKALDTFGKIVDSVELLDQAAIAQDQTDRLFRSRALMVNWSADKLNSVLVPQQWLRLIKDGKDIGYTYIVEEAASDLPRVGKADPTGKPSGVRIGIRSRTVPQPGFVVDTESWFWVRNDLKQEAFRNQLVSHDGDKKPDFAVEIGSSVNRDRLIPVRVEQPGGIGDKIETDRDEKIELQVWSSSNKQQLPAITKVVPPYYLSQGLVHLLPRLLPLRDARTYMFASYVPETRQVMTRYVDVLPITTATLGGKSVKAIPMNERAGLEGTVTTHYLSPEGKYLGSVNADNHIEILSTDEATLKSIWKDAKIERPSAVDDKK